MKMKHIFLYFFLGAITYSMLSQQKEEPLIERVARLEHEQWIEWSQAVADEVSPERKERWEKYWVDYDELSEEVKELDRVYARKVIEEVEKE